jgi:hypothetical protein
METVSLNCVWCLQYKKSAVFIGSKLRAKRPRNFYSIYRKGNRFYFLQSVELGSGIGRASSSVDTGALFPGVKGPGREADY